jgi:ribonuclease HI
MEATVLVTGRLAVYTAATINSDGGRGWAFLVKLGKKAAIVRTGMAPLHNLEYQLLTAMLEALGAIEPAHYPDRMRDKPNVYVTDPSFLPNLHKENWLSPVPQLWEKLERLNHRFTFKLIEGRSSHPELQQVQDLADRAATFSVTICTGRFASTIFLGPGS